MEKIWPGFLNVAQVGIESPLKIQWDDLDPPIESHQGSPHKKQEHPELQVSKWKLNVCQLYIYIYILYIYICTYIYIYTLIIFM